MAEVIPSRAVLRHAVEAEGDVEVRGTTDWTTMPRVDLVWPVGSIFHTVNPDHSTPEAVAEALGGGTWEQVAKGRFLRGQDIAVPSIDTPEETGGQSSHDHDVSLSGSAAAGSDVDAGGGATDSASNLPPYFVTFMWVRRA